MSQRITPEELRLWYAANKFHPMNKAMDAAASEIERLTQENERLRHSAIDHVRLLYVANNEGPKWVHSEASRYQQEIESYAALSDAGEEEKG